MKVKELITWLQTHEGGWDPECEVRVLLLGMGDKVPILKLDTSDQGPLIVVED